jgi:hypothetical protein
MPYPWSETYLSVCFVGKSSKKLWEYNQWIEAVSILQSLVKLSPEKMAVRTTQCDGKDGPKLGRLTWSDKSHQKWTHNSPTNKADSKSWNFMSAEFWAPSWTKCDEPEMAPDVFFSIENPHILKPAKKGQYNQFFQIALPLSIAKPHEKLIRETVDKISRLIDSIVTVGRVDPWYGDLTTMQSDLNNEIKPIGGPDIFEYSLPERNVSWADFKDLKL